MDTKLKNRHKLAVVIILCVICVSSLVMTNQYWSAYQQMGKIEEKNKEYLQTEQDFVGKFVEVCYLLYNTEVEREDSREYPIKERLKVEEGSYLTDCQSFLYLLDYEVLDENTSVMAKMISDSSQTDADLNMSDYALGMEITFDGSSVASATIVQGDYKDEQSVVLRRLLDHFEETSLGLNLEANGEERLLETPKNRTYRLAMSKDHMKDYLSDNIEVHQTLPDWIYNTILILIAVVAGIALLLPMLRSFQTGEEKIFKVPFEIPAIALIVAVAAAFDLAASRIFSSGGYPYMADFILWTVFFGIIYWSTSCLRRIITLGPKRYIKECTLCVPAWKYAKRAGTHAGAKGKEWAKKIYHSLDNIDLSEKNDKTILKIVLVNFTMLCVVTCMWFVGIFALLIYSALLFFAMRKYFNDLKEKYALLLDVTNQMAEGRLDVEISEDLGVFKPFRTELTKIQDGYQKAVEKEVKSQRMKTELITNVSHDLKTPLTAIITYVNLLKEEKDEEKRRDYIDVLERKSLRLKVLIEDLFEISKASSKNVTLHFVKVDVVNLFKQVRLELSEKFEAAELEFRCTYPEEKLIVQLDSQKTYRIFENLLVNVAKYAMPKTRVYVTIEKKEDRAVLRIMNVSAAEMDFDADEITERFMRGDASRNTEGSGLGLAIAKSFTELQKGSFKIETEGDLFKAEVAFPIQ